VKTRQHMQYDPSNSRPCLPNKCFIPHMRCVLVWAAMARATSSGRATRCSLLAPIVPSAELYDRQRTPSPGLMAARLREDRKPRKHQADAAKANPAKGPGAYKQHHEPCPEVLLHAVSPGLVDDLHPET